MTDADVRMVAEWELPLPYGACKKCVEISKTAESVKGRVRPSFDKNRKACMAGKDNLLSFTRHTCFLFLLESWTNTD